MGPSGPLFHGLAIAQAADTAGAYSIAAVRAQVMEFLRQRLIASGIEVLGIRSAPPTLEDIFVSLTRQMDQRGFL